MTKQEAGSKGGRATVARHGPQHMSEIGKAGAAVTWSRYSLSPYGLTQYAMKDRQTGKIVRVIGKAPNTETILGR